MQQLLLHIPHPVLCGLDLLLEEDGFTLRWATLDEMQYARSHCGWTCHVRSKVAAPVTGRPGGNSSDRTETVPEFLALEIGFRRDGLDHDLVGSLVGLAPRATEMYMRRVRALVHSFPMELHRSGPGDVSLEEVNWRHTPFNSAKVLEYLAHMRWEEGDLTEARMCYQSLLPIAENDAEDLALVLRRLEELRAGVPYVALSE